MKNRITINGLSREELDPRFYDLIYDLRNKFGIEGNLYVVICDDKPPYKPNLYGAIIPHTINNKFHIIFDNELTITRGIFKKVNINDNPDELKALIAHEFSHIFNKDSFVGDILRVAWFLSPVIAYVIVYSIVQNILISISFFVICPIIIGRLFNRWRRGLEMRSDRDAINITKNPEASRMALKKMEAFSAEIKNTIKTRDKPLFFLTKICYWVFGRTHPTIPERLQNIESLKQIESN